ncbi:Bowman-Birk type bran trypsin inhibitor [Zea mays]|uniref:Bowman-Birk type bran trypsin inhibitor n=1 Tax=Zea mays TaxID=4577 RepID=A0A1D6E8G8_MAIZE|nr:Bowman-Birk type bran trypsin inhibitor [Zea mays]
MDMELEHGEAEDDRGSYSSSSKRSFGASSDATASSTPSKLQALSKMISAKAAGVQSTGAAEASTAGAAVTGSGAVGRPWECCDYVTKDPIISRPPRWRCNDVVDKCSADCQECEESLAGDGFVCDDWIFSLLEPPVCTPRPWDCCDFAVCTREYIPNCRCGDVGESCPSNCKVCEFVESDPPGYRCLDVFHGYPGPRCTPFGSVKAISSAQLLAST